MTGISQFDRQSYLNLETFRKSGLGVKTPVWFVQDGSTFYIRTLSNSGKVKRIRNNSRVNIVPCKMDGSLVGVWVPAKAVEVKEDGIVQKIDHLLDKKYGLVKKLFALTSALQRQQNTILKVELEPVT